MVRQLIGERRRAASKITEIRSVQYTGNSFRFPVHVMLIFFRDAKPLRIDSDMVARSGTRDMASMERTERRVRQLYEQTGSWKLVHKRYPELSELSKAAAGSAKNA